MDEEGRIRDPEILKHFSPEFDALIVKILLECPRCKPYLYDDKPIARKINVGYNHEDGRQDLIFAITENFGKINIGR